MLFRIPGEEKVFIGYKNTKPLHLPHSFSHNIAYQCSRKIETGFLIQVSHRFRHGSPCFKNTDRNGIISHSISGQEAVSSLPAASLQHIIGHPNLTMVKRYIAFTQNHIKEQEG